MGMYTRLTFWADLAPDSEAVPVVQRLINADADGELPEHGFFKLPHASSVLTCSSAYHRTGQTLFVYDDIAHAWWLNVDSSLKNYGDEIRQFLNWLAPYDTGDNGFRGFFLYEENEHPTLIYRRNGGYVYVESGETPDARA